MHHHAMHERSVHHHVTTQRLTNRRSDANRTAAPRLATRRDAWGTRPATPSPGVGPNGCPEGVLIVSAGRLKGQLPLSGLWWWKCEEKSEATTERACAR
jgi:hypothetical protein